MIGAFGDIVFETSDSRILTFTGFSRETSGRWAKHDVVLRKPGSEFLGPDLESVTFSVYLSASLGVNPEKEMARLRRHVENGYVASLVLGTKAVGANLWAIQSVSQAYETVWSRGEIYSATVDLSLEEYVGTTAPTVQDAIRKLQDAQSLLREIVGL